MNEIEQLLDHAETNYRDMQSLHTDKRYTLGYVYHAHQTLECSLKALCLLLFNKYDRIHSLEILAKQCKIHLESKIDVNRTGVLAWMGKPVTWMGNQLAWTVPYDLDSAAGSKKYDEPYPEDIGIDPDILQAKVEVDYRNIKEKISEIQDSYRKNQDAYHEHGT